jgi:hypothetical protein
VYCLEERLKTQNAAKDHSQTCEAKQNREGEIDPKTKEKSELAHQISHGRRT